MAFTTQRTGLETPEPSSPFSAEGDLHPQRQQPTWRDGLKAWAWVTPLPLRSWGYSHGLLDCLNLRCETTAKVL